MFLESGRTKRPKVTGKTQHTLLVCQLCTLMIMAKKLKHFTDILGNTLAVKMSRVQNVWLSYFRGSVHWYHKENVSNWDKIARLQVQSPFIFPRRQVKKTSALKRMVYLPKFLTKTTLKCLTIPWILPNSDLSLSLSIDYSQFVSSENRCHLSAQICATSSRENLS